jgi:hypothetical protein
MEGEEQIGQVSRQRRNEEIKSCLINYYLTDNNNFEEEMTPL